MTPRGREGAGHRWSSIFHRAPADEVEEELRFHLEERVGELVARGMDREAARALAAARVGELEGVRRECTELLEAERKAALRRHLVRGWLLDCKLGLRMMAKHPALTLIAVISMAVCTAGAAASFAFTQNIMSPTVPFEDGERIVSLQNRNLERG